MVTFLLTVLRSRDVGSGLPLLRVTGTVSVFCTVTWERIHTLQGHTGEVYAAAWTHTGRLVTGSKDQSLRVWDVVEGVCTDELETSCACWLLRRRSVTHKHLRHSTRDHETIHEWDVNTLQHTHSLEGHTKYVPHVTLTTDETQLVSVFIRQVREGVVHDHTHLPADDGVWTGSEASQEGLHGLWKAIPACGSVAQEGDVVAVVSKTNS